MVVNAIGGLCNRMRAIATCLNLAKVSNRQLRIIWRNNPELGADFHDLFLPMPNGIYIHEPSFLEYWLKWEMPRKKNLFISTLYQKLKYRAVYTDVSNLMKMSDNDEAFIEEVASIDGRVLIISGLSVGGYDVNDLCALFRPSIDVEKLIKEKTKNFNEHTIGVHIRRTDNYKSIEKSPLHLFVNEMERMIQDEPRTKFFIATDDSDVMGALTHKFGNRIICGDNKVNRNTLRGMMHATADLWALSKTKGILGSYYSSYTETAAVLGKIPQKIMTC